MREFPKATLIRGGERYGPQPRGKGPVFLLGEVVVALEEPDLKAFEAAGIETEVVDATGCVVVPGFVDPHSHLVGTAGEQGWASRTLDVPYEELVTAGVMTVVGCLGTDDSTRVLSTLLGRVRQLDRQGINAYMYTGSFHVPPPTITKSVRDDLVFIPEVVGIGELAIADFRDTAPAAQELARIASDGLVGGLLGEKAGVLHFHVGPGRTRLSLLRAVLDDYEVPARQLYPTHIARSQELLLEAVELATRGSFVDIDAIEPGLAKALKRYLDAGGPPDRISVSSDAHAPGSKEARLFEEFADALKNKVLPLETLLPMWTRNPADALKLPHKGRLEKGAAADVLVLDPRDWHLRDAFARGRRVMKDGQVVPPITESFTCA